MSRQYTILLQVTGFPVLYKCPHCEQLEIFFPHIFQDPGEASQEFNVLTTDINSFVGTKDRWEYTPDESTFIRSALEK